ncbi:MAG: hypothetical protein KBT48_04295 [Firmicutes bacterium]|nr:hypothetical protein [Bacillota bacterium]
MEIEKGSATYTPWEADYSAKTDKDSGCVKVDYEIYSSKKEDMENTDLTVLLLDKDGFVLGYGSDYLADTIKAGSKGKGTVSIYGDMAVLSQAKDAALFSNPIKF